MTEPMGLDRFRALADAFGGVIDRWPEDARVAAHRLAADPAARAILAEALTLDGELDAWCVPAPDAALAARVAGSAVGVRRQVVRRVRLWWSGLGVATALAGAVAGTAAVAAISPTPVAVESGGAFGDLGPEDGS